MLFIYLLIILCVSLISYQIALGYSNNGLIEGLENSDTPDNNTDNSNAEYKPYNTNDPNNALILAQQNAGNISVLKAQITKLDGTKETIDNMQQNMDNMQTQIDSLTQQQADYAQQISGGSTPPDITGTEPLTTSDVEDN